MLLKFIIIVLCSTVAIYNVQADDIEYPEEPFDLEEFDPIFEASVDEKLKEAEESVSKQLKEEEESINEKIKEAEESANEKFKEAEESANEKLKEAAKIIKSAEKKMEMWKAWMKHLDCSGSSSDLVTCSLTNLAAKNNPDSWKKDLSEVAIPNSLPKGAPSNKIQNKIEGNLADWLTNVHACSVNPIPPVRQNMPKE